MPEIPDIEFKPQISGIEIAKIHTTEDNPRTVFNEQKDNELLISISQKSILTPLIVFAEGDHFVLVDGERRLLCAKKLNFKTVPCRVLKEKPSKLQNLSIMFHVHNVREKWSDIEISVALDILSKELGTDDTDKLSEYSGIAKSQIHRYMKLWIYPKDVREQFRLASGEKNGPDPDLLIEMSRPINILTDEYSGILKVYPIREIVNAMVERKKSGVFTNNPEIRKITKGLLASEKYGVSKKEIEEAFIGFMENDKCSPDDFFQKTSASRLDALHKVKLDGDRLLNTLEIVKTKGFNETERDELFTLLRKIKKLIEAKISEIPKAR